MFKVGDKVRVVGTHRDGRKGKVTEIDGDTIYVAGKLWGCNFNIDQLELIETKEEKQLTGFQRANKFGHPMFYKLLDQMAELHSRKNHDYAGKSDPLKNLRSPKRIGIDPFVGVIIRLQDKWSRLEEFLNSGTLLVKNESVEDTLMDNAVYSLLAIILLREQKEKNGKEEKIRNGK